MDFPKKPGTPPQFSGGNSGNVIPPLPPMQPPTFQPVPVVPPYPQAPAIFPPSSSVPVTVISSNPPLAKKPEWETTVVTGQQAPQPRQPTVITPAAAFPASLERQVFVRRCWSIITDPIAFFSSLDAPLSVSLTHYGLVSILILLIPLVVSAIALARGNIDQFIVIPALLLLPIIELVILGIASLLIHILVKIMGGVESLETTFKLILYLTTFSIPLMIPLLNILLFPFLMMYIPYVISVAFSRSHKISMLRSYILQAVVISAVVFLAILAAILSAALIASLVVPLMMSFVSGSTPLGLLMGAGGAAA